MSCYPWSVEPIKCRKSNYHRPVSKKHGKVLHFFHNEFSPKPKENDMQIPVTVEVNVQFKRTVEMYFKKLLR